MMSNREFQRLLDRSIRYEIEGSVLRISDYRTGQSVALDLGLITDEMFEELVWEDEEDED